jgi:O-antigen/teichoic acid export membrane protein
MKTDPLPRSGSSEKSSSTASLRVTRYLSIVTRFLSDENLTQRAYLNAVASALDYAVQLGVNFLLTPFLVSGLGDYMYGAWKTLDRTLGYISPVGGRATQALRYTIAQQQASTDYEEKRRQVGNAIVVWVLFLPILSVLGVVIAWFAPSWIDAPAGLAWTIRIAAVLMTAQLVLQNLVRLPRDVLEGENLGYKRMGLSALLTVVGGGFTALALYFDTGIVGVVAAALASMVVSGLVNLRILRTYVSWFGVAKPSLAYVRRFLGLSWWFAGWNLVMKLMMDSDIVLLGLLVSMETVTSYTLSKYAPETVVSLVAMVVFGIAPGLGGIIGSGDLRRAASVRGEMMSLTWLIACVTGATVLVWNRAFLGLWVGIEYYAGPTATLLIVVMATQLVLLRNDANVIDLTLNLRSKVLIGAISGVLSLLLAGILVSFFDTGISGLCLGFIVGRSIQSMSYPLIVGRFLGLSAHSQAKGVLRPAFVTVLLFPSAVALGGFLMVTSWIGFVFSVAATFSVVLLLAFFGGLSGTQRSKIIRRIRVVTSATSGRSRADSG